MQDNNEKILHLKQVFGGIVKTARKNGKISLNTLANSFDLQKGNMSKIENGLADCKLSTLWKISEALNIKLSDLIKLLEEKLGKDFHFTDL